MQLKLHPIQAKTVSYQNDGFARDTYISNNGGGFYMTKHFTPQCIHERQHRLFFNTNNLSKTNYNHASVQHYFNDGKGRDTFISVDSGGNEVFFLFKEIFNKIQNSYRQIQE